MRLAGHDLTIRSLQKALKDGEIWGGTSMKVFLTRNATPWASQDSSWRFKAKGKRRLRASTIAPSVHARVTIKSDALSAIALSGD
jgi:hypothetical protein